jgi:cytochrome c-type biogenesis protein CcmF
MNPGNLLLFSSFTLTVLSTTALFTKKTRIGMWLARLAAVLLTGSVLLLAYAFVALDFSIFYVWRHSSSELPVFYRLAVMLVGQEGTYLVWTWLSLLAALLHMEQSRLKDASSRLTQTYALVACSFLLLLTLLMSPFESIFTSGNAVLPKVGNSISPALVDMLMPFHIFTVFVAYAFMLIPAASSLSYFTVGGRLEVKNYLRLSWLFLSLSMILGGLWANRLLGWIGFWQWDPLQSVTMSSWLLVTASLHALVRFQMGEYRRLFPLLCISSFLGFIFTTFVARSGIYSSVHSFPGTPTWWLLVGFMILVFISSVLLSRQVKGAYFDSSNVRAAFSPHNTFYFTILLLIVMAFAALWIPSIYVILKYQGYEASVSPELYNTLFYPLVILLSYLIGICILFGRVQNRTLGYVSAVYFAASLILGFAVPYSAHAIMSSKESGLVFAGLMGSVSVLSYLPVFFFVASSILFKMLRDFRIKSRTALLHVSGVNLIHLGFVFVVMGAVFGSSFSSTHSLSFAFNEEGVYKENDGLSAKLLDFKVVKRGSNWVQFVNLSVDGLEEHMTASFMKNRQFGFISRPAVYHGLASDVKVDFQGSLPHQIQSGRIIVTVKKQPLLSLLWAGCLMFVVGVLLTLASDGIRRKKRKG